MVTITNRSIIPSVCFAVHNPVLWQLCLDHEAVPIRRDGQALGMLRARYRQAGRLFPLDQIGMIALNRIVQRPIQDAQATDQFGRVLAVSYSYPANPDPVLPVILADVGPDVCAVLLRLARHVEGYNEFHNQRRFGNRARKLVDELAIALTPIGQCGLLTGAELNFVLYHAELTIAQPRRMR